MTSRVEVRSGVYHDSVTLMAISRSVSDVEGVDAALVAMATDLNVALLADLGFDTSAAAGAGPNDLLVAIRASGDGALQAGLAQLERALEAGRQPASGGGFGEPPRPRTVGTAASRGAHRLALISVPGRHAFVEAMDALRTGMHVMVFSDNVPVDQEVALKEEAARRGLFVMGPDCGTAVVAGVGLGFANVVRPGPVGIVGASGTGIQQLCCLLDDAGVGITHALGVGGRDLSAAVGGASTLAAVAALDADPATRVVAIVSKPPDDRVAMRVREAAARCQTPVVFAFLGPGQPDLTATSAEVTGILGHAPREPSSWPSRTRREPRSGALRGLFAGGTLCEEAMVIAADALGPVRSNVPLRPDWRLPASLEADGHVMIDFGDDELTRGRPHPMIDQTLRAERIRAEAADPGTAVLLLDVVLGHGAHPDPAAELAPALAAASERAAADGRDLAVVVSLCGTRGDPQGRDRQATALLEAGASVHLSNADAAGTAVGLVERGPP
jgi:FdrA protein